MTNFEYLHTSEDILTSSTKLRSSANLNFYEYLLVLGLRIGIRVFFNDESESDVRLPTYVRTNPQATPLSQWLRLAADLKKPG